MTKTECVENFKKNQVEYQRKRCRMDFWKGSFQRLASEIETLIVFFEERYQNSELTSDFSPELAAKLENRREGIRLSVKSAARLLKKLAPEKLLSDVEREFTTTELLVSELQANKKQSQETENQVQEQHPIPDDSADHSENESLFIQDEEMIDNEYTSMDEKTDELVNDDDKQTPTVDEEPKERQSDLEIIQKALQYNEEIVKELDEYLEMAEERFLKFIEKGVAPVLDGLYSGKSYAKELIQELENSENEQLVQAKLWLSIYDDLMMAIEQLLEQFSIKLYIPQVGTYFDENKQEPIGVVEDDELQNEQVKEVVRFGLICEKEVYHQSSYQFRPAQVIVVKNKKQETSECREEHLQ